jgi:phenylpropionate dioxygenase-like ring-hydroxylating dioxygenase large terminal subunit
MKKAVEDGVYDPKTWVLWDNSGDATADRKFPEPSTLYPNLHEFQRVSADKYFRMDLAEREWQTMWSRTWHCSGRLSDLPAPGSWCRYDVGKESFIVVRGHDGVVRAHYNVCQHRGRRLVDADFGTNLQFVCPYHSWTYDLKGKNIRVTDQEIFGKNALCGDLGLKSAKVEIWGGFVFINMDTEAGRLLDYLGPIPELMKAYRMEDMVIVKDVVLPMPCNWKVGLEAFLEGYHVHATHPQAIPVVDDYYSQFDVFENGHARHVTPNAIPSPRVKDRETVTASLRAFLEDAGIDPATFTGTGTDVRKAIQDHKQGGGSSSGLDYSRFTKSQISDVWNYFVFPNMTLNSHPEGVMVMRFLPHPNDPAMFYYHVIVIMAKLEEGRAPFYMGIEKGVDTSGATRPARIYSTKEHSQLGEVLEQDISNLEQVQMGVRSAGFPNGIRLGELELRLQIFHLELNEYMTGAK